jgi:hypothetical protein
MIRRLLSIFTGFLTVTGCSSVLEDSLPSNQPASFILNEISSKVTPDGILKTWQATSRCDSTQPFKFRLEMLLKTPKEKELFVFSKGAIIREPDRDGTTFLKEVARAIEAKADLPQKSEHKDRLDFGTTILGMAQSRHGNNNIIGGCFASDPPGNWIAFKLFLADGDGEIYLNINPVIGQGEFSLKDPDYGEVVLRELATVFLP